VRDKITRPKNKTMSLDLAERIRDQLDPETLVVLNSWNEPLITDNFEDMLEIFGKCKILFYTNGSLLHKGDIFNAIKNCDSFESIYVSFNGGDKQGYEKTMGLDFFEVKDNVTKLFEVAGKRFPVIITANITPENEFKIENIKDLFPKASKHQIHRPWDIRGLNGKSKPLNKRMFCGRLRHYMAIAYDGTVQACCNMINNEVTFGNINDESIEDIWLGAKARSFRRRHRFLKRTRIPECSMCVG
jgi:radical SAM protein with 4Fe4S-binding SPASM domain